MSARGTFRAIGCAILLFCLAPTMAGHAQGWGWLGVRIRDLSEAEMDEISARHGIREGYGVVIVGVFEDSPAARSALRSGDVVVGFAGRPIVDSRTFQRVVGAAPLDRDLDVTVLRPGMGRRHVPVRLAPMPAELAGERVAAEFGFLLREVSGESAGRSPEPVERLPEVGQVLPGSRAERGGLRAGDVLLRINDEPLLSFRDAALALARAPLDQPLRLMVRRDDNDDLALTLPRPAAP